MGKPNIDVFIGTASSEAGEGIRHGRLDIANGRLSAPTMVAQLPSPQYLCLHPSQRIIYSTAKAGNINAAAIHAFAVRDELGTGLSVLGTAACGEARFCQLSVSQDGRYLMGADYHHGLIDVIALDAAGVPADSAYRHAFDVASRAVPDRQDRPHVHSITSHTSDKWVWVCDFSGDALVVYERAVDGKLKCIHTVEMAPGDGPRHVAVHPNGNMLYVINELSGTVVACSIASSTGIVRIRQRVSILPDGFGGENTSAEVMLSPDSRFLYASNRGHDSVAWMQVDASGALSDVRWESSGGEHPRNLTIDPSGRFLLVANRDSDSVVVFRRDEVTGQPLPTGHQVVVPQAMGITCLAR